MYGVVSQVRARHEGARFDSDVFLIDDGVLPAEVSEAAQVQATRFEPEVFVPPLPGEPVRRAIGDERDEALFFDGHDAAPAVPALSRDDEPIYVNLDFVDGTRGAHVNISGISGVATKTSYATFLLYSIFHSGLLGAEAHNTKALIFNVKGEDLLFLDHPNTQPRPGAADRYGHLGPSGGRRSSSLAVWAPPRRGDASARPDVRRAHVRRDSRSSGRSRSSASAELLPFLFADAEDDRQQYTMVVHNVAHRLDEQSRTRPGDGAVSIDGDAVRALRRARRGPSSTGSTDDDDDTLAGPGDRRGHGQRLRPPAPRRGPPRRPSHPGRRRPPGAPPGRARASR